MKKRIASAFLALFLVSLPVTEAYAYVNVLRPDGSTEEVQSDPDGWPSWIGS